MGSPSTPPPPQNNPGKDLMKYVAGLETALPDVFGLESQYRPEFGTLNLADISRMLGGSDGQAGLYGLGAQANQQSQQQLESARSAEIANMRGNAGDVLSLLGGVNPVGARTVANAGTMADQAYARANGPLSFQDARSADQTARAAFGARGRINDNAAVAAEILGREDVMAARRQEAAQLGASAFGMSDEFSDPALAILGGAPASVALGQDYLNSGKQAIGTNIPQLIDTGAGIQLGQQNASNLANWQSNVSATKNAASAQNTQLATSALGALASMAIAFSDKRGKTDIKKVGKTDGGLPVYTYKLKGSPKTQMGVMAQDVEKEQPDALAILSGGWKGVRYDKIN
jgi:hypothetical protein